MTDKDFNLIFIEESDEVETCLPYAIADGYSDPSATLIALTPAAQVRLKRNGHDAQDTLAYLTPESRDRAWRKSAELSDWIKARFDFEDDLGVRELYKENLVWYSRWLINYLLYSLEILDNAISIHNPKSMVACIPEPVVPTGPWAARGERYFGTLAARLAGSGGIEFQAAHIRSRLPVSERAGHLARRLAVTLVSNPLIARIHRRQLQRFRDNSVVLFTSGTYRMNILADRVSREKGSVGVLISDWGGLRSLGWPLTMRVVPPFAAEARLSLLEALAPEDRGSRRRLTVEIEKVTVEVSEATEKFSHLGVPFGDIVARKLRCGIGPSILGLHRRTAALRLLLDTLRPSMVFANGSRVDDIAMGELCRHSRIPAMMVTHGSHPPPSNDAERYELGEHGCRLINAPYGFTALQSPVAEGYRQTFHTESVALRTGPLIWATLGDRERSAALRQRMFGDPGPNKIIVHAGTPKPAWGMRFNVYETVDEYLQGIRDLAAAVEQVPGALLIVKFRPSPELSVEELKVLVTFSDKTMLSVDEPLLEVLGFTDLLVSFSSTVIEEALQNRVPVLLYGGDGRYKHVPAPGVAKGDTPGPRAAYHVKAAEDLPYALRYILDTCDRRHAGDDLFGDYVYDPEQVVQLPEVLRMMEGNVPSKLGTGVST